MGCGLWLGLMVKDLEGTQLETGDKEVWVRRLRIDISEWVKKLQMLVSHSNAQQRVTSAEEYFNNQVAQMTCSLDTNQLPSLVTLS